MKLRPTLLALLTLPCLFLAACKSKSQTENMAAPPDEPHAATRVEFPDIGGPNAPTDYTKPYQELLASVNAQCPESYPELKMGSVCKN